MTNNIKPQKGIYELPNTVSFLGDLILRANIKPLGHLLTKKVWLLAIQDYLEGNVSEHHLGSLSIKLYFSLNDPNDFIVWNDEELGKSLLFSGDWLSFYKYVADDETVKLERRIDCKNKWLNEQIKLRKYFEQNKSILE